MPKRPWRPDLYVVARFLDKLGDGEGWTKGQLQPAVRLNYDLFIRYIDDLVARGLVQRVGTGRQEIVRITERGVAARRKMLDWIAETFQESW